MNKEELIKLIETLEFEEVNTTLDTHNELIEYMKNQQKEFIKYINKIVKELQKENQELKEQVKEYNRLGFKHLNDKCNKLENQQKEFINKIKELETKLKENGINE